MKDYRLSEIKLKCTGNCFKCDEENEEISKFCRKYIKTYDDYEMPCDWHIEPRDRIELPCKELVRREGGDFWVVYYRSAKYGYVDGKWFDNETDADVFLAYLKRG